MNMMKCRCVAVACICFLSAELHAEVPLRPSGDAWPPAIGAWFWRDSALEPEAYKPFLDAVAAHSPYTLLPSSLRISKGEITDPQIRDQIGKAVRYADRLGLRIAFDLDVRLARRAFHARYPNEQQEELVLKTVKLPATGMATVTFQGRDLTDHMTGNTIPYRCLATRLVRVYSFVRGADGIDPATVRDITDEGPQAVAQGPRKLTVTVPAEAGRCACVMATHTYLTPDVFAPHLLAFQREIVQQYADLPLAGVMKDEWGFPPDHSGNPAHDRFWYSPAMANVYAKHSGGRDLVRDAILMTYGENGKLRERQAAINRYQQLCRLRNASIEDDYYHAGKETFGPKSFVVTHATWTSYPGVQEFRKHGLDWWDATRDIGQCDAIPPYQCCTSLAKRWGYPLWYNQYYAPQASGYVRELWTGALSGGRLNVHPLYPKREIPYGTCLLMLSRNPLLTGMIRLRMLDFITQAPLDCPVAVVFGHACAMNWAGPSYNRVGLDVASALCAQGHLADLIPSSLVGTSAFHLDDGGYVCLGPQRYRAVVLYQPEFGDARELAFFSRAVAGQSEVFLVGDWTRDNEARPLDALKQLGSNVNRCADGETAAAAVTQFLDKEGVTRVTKWSGTRKWRQSNRVTCAAPPMDGHSRLTDGTYVRVAGAKNGSGDPIRETFLWQGHSVTVDAIGVVAIRFASDGQVAAFAASGLKSVRTEGLDWNLPERVDVAFQTNADGHVRGVVQGLKGPLPEPLQTLTTDWQYLAIPSPY